MGQSAEKMAKENGITREEQDRIAFLSHRNGPRPPRTAGPAEMCTVLVPPRYEVAVSADNLLRKDTSMEALARSRPSSTGSTGR